MTIAPKIDEQSMIRPAAVLDLELSEPLPVISAVAPDGSFRVPESAWPGAGTFQTSPVR